MDKVSKSDTPPSIIGPWTLGEKLGEGNYGAVYTCYNEEYPDNEWAMKIVKYADTHSKKRETHLMTANRVLGWENQLYSIGLKEYRNIIPKKPRTDSFSVNENGWKYLVIEKYNGGSLKEKIDSKEISEKTIYSISLRLLDCLQYIHSRRFVYSDLKPENVMIDNKKDDIVLIDYGAVTQYLTYNNNFLDKGSGNGTDAYKSIRSMKLEYPHPYDDLESIAYLTAWMLEGGKLPWDSASSLEELMSIKLKTYKQLLKKYTFLKEYAKQISMIDKTKLEIDYEKLKNIFTEAGGSLRGRIEWEE